MEGILPRGGQGGDGAAVEAVLQRDDLIIVNALVARGPQAGGLDGALICLGTRVREEDRGGSRAGA